MNLTDEQRRAVRDAEEIIDEALAADGKATLALPTFTIEQVMELRRRFEASGASVSGPVGRPSVQRIDVEPRSTI